MDPSTAIGVEAGLGVAAALGLAAGGFAYASLWPASQIFGTSLIAPARPDEIALTFDDGPNPAWTPRLLDVLGASEIKATFFLLGSRAALTPALVQRIVAEGHLVGNHSWSHPNLGRTSVARIREELSRTNETLEQISGKKVEFLRPPFGGRRPAVFRVAAELGLTPVMWNAMTNDWAEPSAEKIAGALTKGIDGLRRKGRAANVVLHDGGHRVEQAMRGPSVQAVEALMATYAGRCRFVRVDAWTAG